MLLQGFFAILIFAFVPLAIKYTSANPVTICLARLLITVFVLSLVWRKKIQFPRKAKELWGLLLLGGVFFFHWISYAYAVKFGGPAIAVLSLSTYGIQLVLASCLLIGHKINKKDLACLVMCLIGITLIIPSWDFKNQITLGAALGLFSASCFAIIPILHRRLNKHNQETRIFFQFFGALIGFSFLFPLSNWEISKMDWGIIIYLGIFGTLIAHSLWAHITSKISPVISGMSYYTIAPITLICSHFLFAERFSHLQLVGALVVITSAIASSYDIKKV